MGISEINIQIAALALSKKKGNFHTSFNNYLKPGGKVLQAFLLNNKIKMIVSSGVFKSESKKKHVLVGISLF